MAWKNQNHRNILGGTEQFLVETQLQIDNKFLPDISEQHPIPLELFYLSLPQSDNRFLVHKDVA